MKTIVISIEFLRKDVADQVFSALPKTNYDYHFSHYTFTLPTFERLATKLVPKENSVFLSDSFIFSKLNWISPKEIFNTHITQDGLDGYADDRKKNTEVLAFKLEEKIKGTADFIWCHFWRLLHDESLTNYFENARFIANLIIGIIEKYPEHKYIITADHAICFDGEYTKTRRELHNGSLHIPLYMTGENKTITSMTNHDGLAEYLNGNQFPKITTSDCFFMNNPFTITKDGVITPTESTA